MAMRNLCAVFAALVMSGCAGYQLGGAKPAHLADIQLINVQVVRNDTQIPRAAAHATNAIIDALTRDGTYRLATVEKSDARLDTVLKTIEYRQARSTRTDSLRSEELEMKIILSWVLLDSKNPLRILESGTSEGTTRFFVDPNLQTARQSALSDALKRASENVVARLADGF
jgi:hypothetical protein